MQKTITSVRDAATVPDRESDQLLRSSLTLNHPTLHKLEQHWEQWLAWLPVVGTRSRRVAARSSGIVPDCAIERRCVRSRTAPCRVLSGLCRACFQDSQGGAAASAVHSWWGGGGNLRQTFPSISVSCYYGTEREARARKPFWLPKRLVPSTCHLCKSNPERDA